MIVVDPHAFRRLWPALGIWLFLFLTAGDGWTTSRRQVALHFGRPAEATVLGKSRRSKRNYLSFSVDGAAQTEAVGRHWAAVSAGQRVSVHKLGPWAFLDDDYGYSRWKLIVFGGAFAALWLWALGRYRFG